MSLIKRLKRLWEIAGENDDGNTTAPAARFFTSESKRKRRKKLATVLQDDPLDVFPSEEIDNEDSTSERPSTDRAD